MFDHQFTRIQSLGKYLESLCVKCKCHILIMKVVTFWFTRCGKQIDGLGWGMRHGASARRGHIYYMPAFCGYTKI